ncbi:DsbA family protein [Pararhizobium antarcticum]|uniref:Disulfide bond formation protein DsbA n=1 Tax=Pararhizobium antarcticum TaxID=1798805 RepID=A0A657LYQ3_9HYPH|nr:DsbA family protein [Pararhizobium antarcticum]OJG00282.1 disulfide bond formation protein DsbA [Pararhizobium antarcticum]OJG00912.1 disulfide bond formation protein DsbA [Rhizobium sp. 58]
MAFKLRTIIAGSLALLTAATVLPSLANALDDKQKEEIGAFIKEYLVANPEILLEAQKSLKLKQEQAQLEQAKAAIDDNSDAIFQSVHDVTLGNPKGDVTVVEFYDYNCGYCKRALADMDALLEKDKNVRFVLKELPILGPDSLAAHKVSAAFRLVAPEKYGDFHRALLTGEDRATEETAIAVAGRLGVAEANLRAKMVDPATDESVKEAYTLANTLGITGTPSYVIGKEAVFGAVGAEELETKVTNMRSCGSTIC